MTLRALYTAPRLLVTSSLSWSVNVETLLLSCEAAGTFSNEAFTRSSSGSGLGSVAVPDRADADAVVDLGVHGVRQTHLERLVVV